MDRSSTITAIATPYGQGGIGVLRISGPDAFDIGMAVFRRHRTSAVKAAGKLSYTSHRFYYGHIVDPEKDGFVDEVLAVFMRAPATYTREDIVEIHSHSGPFVLRRVLDLVLKNGAELAQPGEFTKRAFLNGRIDLTQAEAVIDIINARTEAALTMATSQLGGNLSTALARLKGRLDDLQSRIAASIDFPEEVGDIIDFGRTRRMLENQILPELRALLENYEQGRVFKDGVKMAIVGTPNVGKSSLMNRLVAEERSIVTAIPGTTRDLVEDRFTVNGFPIIVTDTAGIHDTQDPIEKIGVGRARACIDRSDLVLFMVEAQRPLSAEERALSSALDTRRVIRVVNKIDLVGYEEPVVFDGLQEFQPVVYVSAKEDKGVDRLRNTIGMVCQEITGGGLQLHLVPSQRQKEALDGAHAACRDFLAGLNEQRSPELLAIDLGEAIERVNSILGINVSGDVLDRVFADFCIGK